MNRLWLILLLVGCAVTEQSEPVPSPAVKANLLRAEGSPNDDRGLNLSVLLFKSDMSIQGPDRAKLLPAEIRYLTYLLRQQVVASGFWGAVRVTPTEDVTAEVTCAGRLIDVRPAHLAVGIKCQDALGQVWFEETFSEEIAAEAYLQSESADDPYLNVMTQIANRLAEARAALSDQDERRLVEAAVLRYGYGLSQKSFQQYLALNQEGIWRVTRLPSVTDPMFQRVMRIRESEYQLIDALDEQFSVVFEAMVVPYRLWRQYQYEFEVYNQALGEKSSERSRQVAADYQALLSTYRRYQDYRRNEDELAEMSESFMRSLTPTLARVEGQVLELTGNLDQQYELWRSYLRQIYQTSQVSASEP